MKRCEDHKNETADRTKEMRYLALNTGVAPIFYDDIEPQFFGSKGTDYARRTVLSLAQIATEPDSRVALIIGSTNAEGVTLKDEVQRRVKFLLFTCKFPDEGNDQERPFFKPESKIELKQIASQLNNSLYLDFLYRMSAKFADPNTSFDFETNNAMDYLSFARNIFKDYYRMIDYPLSEYFPSEPVIGDYSQTGKDMWHDLYISEKEQFKENELGILTLNTVKTIPHLSNYDTASSIARYRNTLPITVCVDANKGKQGNIIMLKKKDFLKWIDEKAVKPSFKQKLKYLFS